MNNLIRPVIYIGIFVLTVYAVNYILTPRTQQNSLITQYHQTNDTCRDGDPELESTWLSCNQRDIIVKELLDQGYCWGREDQAEYQRRWQPCGK